MRTLPRPCLDCGRLHANQTRCPRHQRASKTPTNPAYNDPEYKRNRRRMIEEHVTQYGWVCPGAADLNHEAHPCSELTADHHPTPLSAGGGNGRDNLRVLCQWANSSKGGTNRLR